MDRQTVYPGQILPETTLLQIAKDSMVGLAKLSAAIFGVSTMANGFAVTPTGPASLQVVVAPGELYSLTAVDGTAWSSLAADTTHTIVKQGIALDSTTLTCAAPTTNGQSISYLIQASYLDLDSTPVLLPYYNSANPSQPYSGLGNNGLTQNTVRKGTVVLSAKAGASAATGSQVTPSPDAGYVGLYVVTVANGQTTITSASIARYSSAPIIPAGLVQSVQAGSMTYAAGAGAAGAYTAAFAPAITALADGLTLHSTAIAANTGASTFSPNGLTAKPIMSLGQAALIGGELVANSRFSVRYSATLDAWILLSASGGNAMSGRLINTQVFTANGTYTPIPGMRNCRIRMVAGGGGSGATPATSSTQTAASSGGAGGGYTEGWFTAAQIGVSQVVQIAAGGTAGIAGGAAAGTGGNTYLGSILMSALGGAGGLAGAATTSTAPILTAGGRPGAVGVGGTIFSTGDQGGASIVTGGYTLPGAGGGSKLGAGAGLGVTTSAGTAPLDGPSYGSGASGRGSLASQAAQNGAAGAQGIMIIEEYA